MRTNQYEFMRPDEILEAQKEKSIVYLPVGPLEWHGPAMPFGVDPLIAKENADRIAEATGGVVLPTLYAGTERERKDEVLDAMGFEDPKPYVIGQDFPKNSLPSFYMREEVFSLVIREYLRILTVQGYELIVILNGHGAENQKAVLERLAAEFSAETNSRVYVAMAVAPIDESSRFEGHGTKSETAQMMFVNEESVDLSMLPPREIKLKNCDWGITGATAYALKPNEDHTMEEECDPRDATVDLGRRYFEEGIKKVIEEVNDLWEKMHL